jgi:hypothetical protein
VPYILGGKNRQNLSQKDCNMCRLVATPCHCSPEICSRVLQRIACLIRAESPVRSNPVGSVQEIASFMELILLASPHTCISKDAPSGAACRLRKQLCEATVSFSMLNGGQSNASRCTQELHPPTMKARSVHVNTRCQRSQSVEHSD